MRILVTGANGFIGRHVCEQVHVRGHPLRRAVRVTPTGADGSWVAVGDVNHATDWATALDGQDAIIHLAARAHVLREESADPLELFREVNTHGALRLAEQATSAGVRRLVFVSSIGVHGDRTAPGHSITERDAPQPHSPYAVAKWEAEQELTALAARTGLEVVIVRPPLVYGPGAPGNFAALARLVARGLPLPLGNTGNERSLVGVRNLSQVLVLCAEHPAAAGQTFVISDVQVSTTNLIRRLAAAFGRPVRLFPVPQSVFRVALQVLNRERLYYQVFGSLLIDSNLIRTRLGWEPVHDVDDELRRVAAWASSNTTTSRQID
jgi:nucleoside-diphosphate-sugar epimerase